MINENKSVRDLKRMVLIGAIVALVSQLYWNLFVYNFRISSSVIVLPVLLMTLGKNLSTTMTCSVTAVIVFLFRLTVAVNGDADFITSAESLLFLLRDHLWRYDPRKTYRVLQPVIPGSLFR